VAVVIAAVVGAAWLVEMHYSRPTRAGASGSGAATASAYGVDVKQHGKVLKRYDLAALRGLPQAHFEDNGKTQTGPELTVLLADAGASGYTTVAVRGAGLRDGGNGTYSAAQVRRGVQLDFSERGTCKVCGPHLARTRWVRDVLSVDAE
jgi:hypothetical protein